LKLSDYRGKVVAVVFWGHCGGCRPDARALRDAQEHLADRPFAIIGVFNDDHPEDAKSIAEELGMNWPSFKEKRDGPIATAWHSREWPNIWLLDQRGVIRQRGVREESVVRAVERLLGQSQAAR
jgi:peroxiredoxin